MQNKSARGFWYPSDSSWTKRQPTRGAQAQLAGDRPRLPPGDADPIPLAPIYAFTTDTAPGHTAGTGAARTGPLSAPFWAGPWTALNLNLQPEAGHQHGPAGQSRPAVWALGVTRAAGWGAGYRDAGAGMPLPSNGSNSRRQSSDQGCRLWISRCFVTVGTAGSIRSSQNLGMSSRATRRRLGSPPAGRCHRGPGASISKSIYA
jgi:hypothetical protein